jgi:hypothetical protein
MANLGDSPLPLQLPTGKTLPVGQGERDQMAALVGMPGTTKATQRAVAS